MTSPEGAGDTHVVILLPAAQGLAAPGAASTVYFRPMVRWVIEAASGLSRRSMGVSGSATEAESAHALKDLHGVRYYGLKESPFDAACAAAAAHPGEGDVLVVDGARVLLTREDLASLLARHAGGAGAGSVLMASGEAAGVWCWRRSALEAALEPQGEIVPIEDPMRALAVRDLESLSRAEEVLQRRYNHELMRRGVMLTDPRTTRVDPACRLAPGVAIEAGCVLVNTGVEAGARVEAFCRLTNSEIGAGSLVRQGSIVVGSRMGKGCRVGPYALLTGARLEDESSVNGFSEFENASLGRGSRTGSLSYVGNCRIGRNVEIGSGFQASATGAPADRHTIIEDDVFIGSASQAVASVTVGRGSFVATGTSITDDAPPDSFVISRGRQVIKAGYGRRHSGARRSS